MPVASYVENDLVTNRASVLVVGGAEADRRAWAEVAASVWEAPLVEGEPAQLAKLLQKGQGVVYVADVAKVPNDVQREVARVLHAQEERPKVVVGSSLAAETALAKGTLRDDLWFALRRAVVDLADPKLKEATKKRHAKLGGKKR